MFQYITVSINFINNITFMNVIFSNRIIPYQLPWPINRSGLEISRVAPWPELGTCRGYHWSCFIMLYYNTGICCLLTIILIYIYIIILIILSISYHNLYIYILYIILYQELPMNATLWLLEISSTVWDQRTAMLSESRTSPDMGPRHGFFIVTRERTRFDDLHFLGWK